MNICFFHLWGKNLSPPYLSKVYLQHCIFYFAIVLSVLVASFSFPEAQGGFMFGELWRVIEQCEPLTQGAQRRAHQQHCSELCLAASLLPCIPAPTNPAVFPSIRQQTCQQLSNAGSTPPRKWGRCNIYSWMFKVLLEMSWCFSCFECEMCIMELVLNSQLSRDVRAWVVWRICCFILKSCCPHLRSSPGLLWKTFLLFLHPFSLGQTQYLHQGYRILCVASAFKGIEYWFLNR